MDDTGLQKALKELNYYETEEESIVREKALGQLNHLVQSFVIDLGVKRGMTREEARSAGGIIHTFGSYRLGVHNKNADIDSLCVVPQHVARKDFYTIFYDVLRSNKDITSLVKIEDSYVPLMKFEYKGLSFDLLFCRLNLRSVTPEIDLTANEIIRNLEEKCVLSINGCRVANKLLSLVPNTKAYHLALKAIKYWARQRAVYGNSFSYPGGIAFALMLARVAQLNANASACELVKSFFSTYLEWKWPEPVTLCAMEQLPYGMRVWNPTANIVDRMHKMPVITPVYPYMCATHNITLSTMGRLTTEYTIALDALKKDEPWKELFKKDDYFSKHTNYVQVVIWSSDAEFDSWAGFVESKIRHLAAKIEVIENVASATVYPKQFKKKVGTESEVMETHTGKKERESEGKELSTGAFYVGLDLSPFMTLNKSKRKLNAVTPVKEFKKLIEEWDKKTDTMCIAIRTLKRSELPCYVNE